MEARLGSAPVGASTFPDRIAFAAEDTRVRSVATELPGVLPPPPDGSVGFFRARQVYRAGSQQLQVTVNAESHARVCTSVSNRRMEASYAQHPCPYHRRRSTHKRIPFPHCRRSIRSALRGGRHARLLVLRQRPRRRRVSARQRGHQSWSHRTLGASNCRDTTGSPLLRAPVHS